MREIPRVVTAMVTPFRGVGDKSRVDYDSAGRLANNLLDSGSEAVLVAGTTGLSSTLSERYEHPTLIRKVVRAVDGRAPVVAGAGTNDTRQSKFLVKHADEAGADAVLLVVPYYLKTTQRGLYRHFAAIAESTDLPCILYNVPSRTVNDLDAETTLELAKIPNIIGIKEASGDMVKIGQIIDGAPEGFKVWSGDDNKTLMIIRRGGYGVVGVVTHLVGVQVWQMIDAELAGNHAEADEIHNRISPLIDKCFAEPNPGPIQFIMNEIGWRVGQPRSPIFVPEDDLAERIMVEVRRHKIDLKV